MSEKKIGRPTISKKEFRLTVRLDENTFNKLEKYCNKNKVKYSEGIRDGINKLDEKK